MLHAITTHGIGPCASMTIELAPKAAVQTRADDAHDALWELDLSGRAVTLTRRPWELRPGGVAP